MANQPKSARDLFWNILFNQAWQHTVEEKMLVDFTKIVFRHIFDTFLKQPLKAVQIMGQVADVLDYDTSKTVVAKTWTEDNCPTFKVLKALSDELNEPMRKIVETPNDKVRLENPQQTMTRLVEKLGDSPAFGGRKGVWMWFNRLKNPQCQETMAPIKKGNKKHHMPKKHSFKRVGPGLASLDGCLDTPDLNGVHTVDGIPVMPDNADSSVPN